MEQSSLSTLRLVGERKQLKSDTITRQQLIAIINHNIELSFQKHSIEEASKKFLLMKKIIFKEETL